ncbi:MAG: glutamine synthetase family protein [Christensenellales bacterium]|jgi:glutamine synthetase
MAVFDKHDIMQLIKDNDVRFIRMQFTDLFGTLKNLAVAGSRVENAVDNGIEINAPLFGYGEGKGESLILAPDLDTFSILPWRPQKARVSRIICDIKQPDGRPFFADARQMLKSAAQKAKSKGYIPRIAASCKFYLFQTDDRGRPLYTFNDDAAYLSAEPSDLGDGVRRDMCFTMEDMGFEIEALYHCKDAGQHEISFKPDGAVRTADGIATFKMVARTIAARHGLHATFMPMPKGALYGSDMSLRLSLDGDNAFYKAEAGKGLSETAYMFLSGVLECAGDMAAITNPTVNSYKRLLKSGGRLARLVGNCGPEDIYVELMWPDAAANPYLTLATAIRAGLYGIEKGDIELRRGEKHSAMPRSLLEAVQLMESSPRLNEWMGRDAVEMYIDCKRREYREYDGQVHDWEMDRYLKL